MAGGSGPVHMPGQFFTETSGWFTHSESPASSESRRLFPGHLGKEEQTLFLLQMI